MRFLHLCTSTVLVPARQDRAARWGSGEESHGVSSGCRRTLQRSRYGAKERPEDLFCLVLTVTRAQQKSYLSVCSESPSWSVSDLSPALCLRSTAATWFNEIPPSSPRAQPKKPQKHSPPAALLSLPPPRLKIVVACTSLRN